MASGAYVDISSVMNRGHIFIPYIALQSFDANKSLANYSSVIK